MSQSKGFATQLLLIYFSEYFDIILFYFPYSVNLALNHRLGVRFPARLAH